MEVGKHKRGRRAMSEELHDFRKMPLTNGEERCSTCGNSPNYRQHAHTFKPTRVKSICVCGLGSTAIPHLRQMRADDEAREEAVRAAAEQDARSHDADVIMAFKKWISKQGDDPIEKKELIKMIDWYAVAVELGTPVRVPGHN